MRRRSAEPFSNNAHLLRVHSQLIFWHGVGFSKSGRREGLDFSFSLDIFIFFAPCGADNGHFALEAFAPASKVAIRDGRHGDSSLQEALPSPFFIPSLENSTRSVFICGEGCGFFQSGL